MNDNYISIVIPNHNRADALKLTLDSLVQQTYPPDLFEVIVVDQASTDDSRDLVRHYTSPFRLRLVEQDAKYGISVARNAGMDAANNAFVLIIDSDIIPDPGVVEAHIYFHTQHPGGLVCGRVLSYKPAYVDYFEIIVDPDGELNHGDRERLLPFYEAFGNHLSLAVDTFHTIGPWDPTLLRAQDMEFAYRAEQLGIPIFNCPKAISFHNHPRTIQERFSYPSIYWWPEIFKRYPDMKAHLPWISMYEPINWKEDKAKRIYRKLIARFYAIKLVQWSLLKAIILLNNFEMLPRVIKAFYYRLFIGYQYLGFQEGMKRRQQEKSSNHK